jgi:hypothetical protein
MQKINKELFLNPAQLQSAMMNAQKEAEIAGRATGKSSGFAWKIHKVNEEMPRSSNAFAGATFKQLLTRTLPPVVSALERLGYHKDIHYVIGHKPPAALKYEQPFEPALEYDRFMQFKDGTGFHLTSQDREGKNRGFNLNFILADELLTLDKKKLEDEVFASNRGGPEIFKKSKLNHGWRLASSMPTSAKSNWILEYGNYYDEEGNSIWLLWNRICRLQLQFIESKIKEEQLSLLKEIQAMKKSLRFYADKSGVLFSVSNVFDNIKIVGLDYIREMRRQMPLNSFRLEILNEKITAVENNFYKLREEVHLYDAPNYSYLDNLEYDFTRLSVEDSRMDSDVNLGEPLDLGIDFGGVINSVRIAQENHMDLITGRPLWNYRFLKSFYVKHPKGLTELVNDITAYYAHHPCKELNIPYDQTAIGRDAVRALYIDELTALFIAKGWKVNAVYLGQAAGHHARYLLYEKMLGENDASFPVLRYNRTNDKDGILSMQLAGLLTKKNGFEKDKRPEQSTKIPREQATDLSDAGDILLCWKYLSKLDKSDRTFEMLMG